MQCHQDVDSLSQRNLEGAAENCMVVVCRRMAIVVARAAVLSSWLAAVHTKLETEPVPARMLSSTVEIWN